MTLSKNGVNTFHSEVTNISSSGFWLLVEDREYFVPFEDYPAFKKATVEQIYQFQQLNPEQFHWEELDIDIELNALKHPEQYLLKFQ
jgi:hypothetical protein